MTTATNITNAIQAIGNNAKAIKTLINGNTADLSSLTTTAKTNLVAALNELKGNITTLQTNLASAAVIDDVTTVTNKTWSSSKINDTINSAITALTTGAPAALNTLDELASALGDDANFAATVTASLGNRLRFDSSQTLTAPQKIQANTNLGSVSLAEFGDPATDYVAVFNAAIV